MSFVLFVLGVYVLLNPTVHRVNFTYSETWNQYPERDTRRQERGGRILGVLILLTGGLVLLAEIL